jgi:hypothetical protein
MLTLALGIFDLNSLPQRLKPLTIQDIYVAISRFTSLNDFKICQVLDEGNLQHLSGLRWPCNLKYFYGNMRSRNVRVTREDVRASVSRTVDDLNGADLSSGS